MPQSSKSLAFPTVIDPVIAPQLLIAAAYTPSARRPLSNRTESASSVATTANAKGS